MKKLKTKGIFGEFSFLTGFKQIYAAKASTYTQVYKISHENFAEVLSKFPKDYEKYCEIKDQIILYQNYKNYNLRCKICSRKEHINKNCPLTQFIPNKEHIFLRNMYSDNQIRRPYKRKHMHNFHSLSDKKKILNKVKVFQSKMKTDSNISSDDSNSSLNQVSENMNQSISLKNYVQNNDTFIEKKPFMNMKEIENGNNLVPCLNKKHSNFFEENVMKSSLSLQKSRKTMISYKKNQSVFLVNTELEMDHVKEFNNYFPQGNAKFIVTKMQNLKTLSRKKKEIDSELTKKPGYFLWNKALMMRKNLKKN